MHLTLKQYTALPPRSSLQAQQVAFDQFRDEYNNVRPHHALEMKVPADVYAKSTKCFPGRIPEVEYATNIEVMRVSDQGTIGYGQHRVFISSALRGEDVGLEEISERHRRIHFSRAALGVLDVYTGKLIAYKHPLPIVEANN